MSNPQPLWLLLRLCPALRGRIGGSCDCPNGRAVAAAALLLALAAAGPGRGMRLLWWLRWRAATAAAPDPEARCCRGDRLKGNPPALSPAPLPPLPPPPVGELKSSTSPSRGLLPLAAGWGRGSGTKFAARRPTTRPSSRVTTNLICTYTGAQYTGIWTHRYTC